MGQPYFAFKKFKVWQDKCAMKVCTDACILGAYVYHPEAQRILDIGAGTGLLSLMLAQRHGGQIEALEIDPGAADQAKRNFKESPWPERLNLHHIAAEHFDAELKYDLIVCNPPFYPDHMPSPKYLKNQAMHQRGLKFADLANLLTQWLSAAGHVYIMLPPKQMKHFMTLCTLHARTRLKIYDRSSAHVLREIVMFQFEGGDCIEKELTIYHNQREYTPSFVDLLKDYYLYL